MQYTLIASDPDSARDESSYGENVPIEPPALHLSVTKTLPALPTSLTQNAESFQQQQQKHLESDRLSFENASEMVSGSPQPNPVVDNTLTSRMVNITIKTYADATNIASLYPELAPTVLTMALPSSRPTIPPFSVPTPTQSPAEIVKIKEAAPLLSPHMSPHTSERPNWALAPDSEVQSPAEPTDRHYNARRPKAPSKRSRDAISREFTSFSVHDMACREPLSKTSSRTRSQESEWGSKYDHGFDYRQEPPTPPYMGTYADYLDSKRGNSLENKPLPPKPIPSHNQSISDPAPYVHAFAYAPPSASAWGEPSGVESPSTYKEPAFKAPPPASGAFTYVPPPASAWGEPSEANPPSAYKEPVFEARSPAIDAFTYIPPSASAWFEPGVTQTCLADNQRSFDPMSETAADAYGYAPPLTYTSAVTRPVPSFKQPRFVPASPEAVATDSYTYIPPPASAWSESNEVDSAASSINSSSYAAQMDAAWKAQFGGYASSENLRAHAEDNHQYTNLHKPDRQNSTNSRRVHEYAQNYQEEDEWTGSLPASAYGASGGSSRSHRGGRRSRWGRSYDQDINSNKDDGRICRLDDYTSIYADNYGLDDEWTGSLPASAYGSSSSKSPKRKGGGKKGGGRGYNDHDASSRDNGYHRDGGGCVPPTTSGTGSERYSLSNGESFESRVLQDNTVAVMDNKCLSDNIVPSGYPVERISDRDDDHTAGNLIDFDPTSNYQSSDTAAASSDLPTPASYWQGIRDALTTEENAKQSQPSEPAESVNLSTENQIPENPVQQTLTTSAHFDSEGNSSRSLSSHVTGILIATLKYLSGSVPPIQEAAFAKDKASAHVASMNSGPEVQASVPEALGQVDIGNATSEDVVSTNLKPRAQMPEATKVPTSELIILPDGLSPELSLRRGRSLIRTPPPEELQSGLRRKRSISSTASSRYARSSSSYDTAQQSPGNPTALSSVFNSEQACTPSPRAGLVVLSTSISPGHKVSPVPPPNLFRDVHQVMNTGLLHSSLSHA
ncbi:hypothetical protein BDP27DRAFT_1414137 [Rhodocollybia butyracea]|uniref:Uncharacterized protein n=1 Tax=Rhodocollybia butyracea TaxID=206335 RepID=A0A9P5Q9Y1_9AGAR|nr:hypothetical protein BDP27DRAFT_1414137 [Rhodocollybia butyracea]